MGGLRGAAQVPIPAALSSQLIQAGTAECQLQCIHPATACAYERQGQV